jgi:hypothetical protein
LNKQYVFEQNLLALSQKDPALCSRLSLAETTRGRYRFLETRSGETTPALTDASGAAHPLHSLVDPRREADRLLSASMNDADGCLVLLGLGGGYAAEAALERPQVQCLVVVDYDIHGAAELLAAKPYIRLFQDPRFHLLVDPDGPALEAFVLETYRPALYGGIRVLPLRARTALDPANFAAAGAAVTRAMDRLTGDYSAQAFFGTRWFANIIRNLFAAEGASPPLPPVKRAAVVAAGPSLDAQFPRLARTRQERFVIATDTALPALLSRGLTPDAVISLDCQHISCLHFMGGLPPGVPLFLDLASPPLLASLAGAPRFFSGGHPLTRYVARFWRPFPALDTSGANVTHAAVSLADRLGAAETELYGADFSYPHGASYARGTYRLPYFAARQDRLSPLAAQEAAFLYRSAALRKENAGNGRWYYETPLLRGYREALERAAPALGTSLCAVPGGGAPLRLPPHGAGGRGFPRLFSAGAAAGSAAAFLEGFRRGIAALPLPGRDIAAFLARLSAGERLILETLLPSCAALRRRRADLDAGGVLEAVKGYCLEEIGKVLRNKEA